MGNSGLVKNNFFQHWVNHLQGIYNLTDIANLSFSFNSNNEVYYLVPFSKNDILNDERIAKLSVWREKHKNTFPTRFPITESGTRKWVEFGVLGNDQRILFWIVDLNLKVWGHLGVVYHAKDDIFEVDNVLRGEDGSPGLMHDAMIKLMAIVESEFSSEIITLRVLKSNERAINFYKNLDFEIYKEEELTLIKEGETAKLVPGLPAHDSFLYMERNILNLNQVPDLILTAGPSISTLEKLNVSDAVQNGWNLSHSDYITKFENNFADYIGAKYAIATSSCTGALHLALLALGITSGDEVLVPDITWVATASAVRYVGATPVFVDVDLDTWTISVSDIKTKINSKTRAIIPVHLYGFASNMPEILNIAHTHGLKVIEDAAPAIGTTIAEKKVGTFGDIGCFSFQGAKLLVTGEGGMLVTDDEGVHKKVKKLQEHGRKPGTFWIEELGYKYKMNNITAALGVGQLSKVENQIFRKRRIHSWYRNNLVPNINGIKFQEAIPNSESIYWMTSILIPEGLKYFRDEVISELKKKGIDSRPVFPSISQYVFWDKKQTLPKNSETIGKFGINLPSGVNLGRDAIDKVSETLIELLAH